MSAPTSEAIVCPICARSTSPPGAGDRCPSCGLRATRAAGGVFEAIASPGGAISYPSDGAEHTREVEESSFWFAHRSDVIAWLLGHYPCSGTMLDVGGGNGLETLRLQARQEPVVMVEPGPRACANARARGVERVLRATLEGLHLHPETVGAVCFFDVLEHIEAPLALLHEALRILRPGGRLYLTVPALDALWSNEDDTRGTTGATRARLAQLARPASASIFSRTIFGHSCCRFYCCARFRTAGPAPRRRHEQGGARAEELGWPLAPPRAAGGVARSRSRASAGPGLVSRLRREQGSVTPPLPNFIIAGVLGAGTGQLYALLLQHPDVYLPLPMAPECNFFYKTAEYEKGIDYYVRRYFSAWSGQHAIGERSSLLLSGEWVPERLRVPCPTCGWSCSCGIGRARYAHYRFTAFAGFEELTFEQALRAEDARADGAGPRLAELRRYAYFRRGCTSSSSALLALLPRERVLVLRSDALVAGRDDTMRRVFAFLRSGPLGNARRSRRLPRPACSASRDRAARASPREFDAACNVFAKVCPPRLSSVIAFSAKTSRRRRSPCRSACGSSCASATGANERFAALCRSLDRRLAHELRRRGHWGLGRRRWSSYTAPARMSRPNAAPGTVIWITGLPGSGRTTLAKKVQHILLGRTPAVRSARRRRLPRGDG